MLGDERQQTQLQHRKHECTAGKHLIVKEVRKWNSAQKGCEDSILRGGQDPGGHMPEKPSVTLKLDVL